jgi:putative RecB family exonuclease
VAPGGGAPGGVAPGGVAPERPRRPVALSPSRASDFKACPLLYRFRAVDRLPEPPSPDAVRGSLVHSVLEDMFGRPAAERTPSRTAESVLPAWERMARECPELGTMLPAQEVTGWLDSARALVRSYFTLEDPRRFDPQACEYAVEIDTADGVPLRGFIDRLDLAPTGELRIVDYKTGRSPGPDFEGRALYQLKFYALMIYRLRGVVPAQLKLIYLADGMSLQYAPTEQELRSFSTTVGALWRAVSAALESGNFPARRGPMCRWCAHQALCPEYGGTPPPYPGPPAELTAGRT